MVWAEIDLDHLRHNLNVVRRALKKPLPEMLAVVKADAYGHGMKQVALALEREGVHFFGVANIDEAMELRSVCREAKILVLGSFHESQAPLYRRARIRPTLSSEEDARVLEKTLPRGRRFPVHVKIDTGMGRLGVWHEEAEKLFETLSQSKKIEVEGVYTHFSGADQSGGDSTRRQIFRFNLLRRKLMERGVNPVYWHAANSLGVLRFPDSHLNLVRPGILFYGLNPMNSLAGVGLKPVMSLKTLISFLKKVRAGRALSYGGAYRTTKETWIATLPVGYSHGYRIGFSNNSSVLVNGRRCPVVGRVTMDQMLVDVGPAWPVKRWDEVVLIGRSGKEVISAEELAAKTQTIPYEIVCSIHSRIPRIYKGL